MPQLMGNGFGLDLNHRRRQLKAHFVIQHVQEFTLENGTGRTGIFLFKPLFDLILQRTQIFGPEFLGQLIIDLGGCRFFYRSDCAREFSGLTGQVLGLVLFWEADFDDFFFFGFHAHELFFEAWDKAIGTKHQRIVFGAAAFKGFTIDASHEIHNDLIAVLGLGAFFAVDKVLRAFRQVG